MNAMIRLDVNGLLEGMVIAEPVLCPKTGKVLLKHGTKITDSLIQTLITRGIKTVAVAEQYTLLVDPVDTTTRELRGLLEDGIVKYAPDTPEANKSDNMVNVSRMARKIVSKILENPDIVQFCVISKLLDDNFLYRHSINTCVLSLLVAGAMGFDAYNMQCVGTGALLHDIGLCEMPALINPQQRSPQQESLWKEHPRYGYYFAKEAGLPDNIINMILNHHEYWDGSGYPRGIGGNDIPIGARIITVCETYDRLLNSEGYPHYQAIEYLYGGGNFYFDSQVVKSFTNNIAVYPLGSMVRLSTGEVGIVVNVRKNLGPRPMVRVYYNRVNRPLSCPKDVDLGEERTVFIEKVL